MHNEITRNLELHIFQNENDLRNRDILRQAKREFATNRHFLKSEIQVDGMVKVVRVKRQH
jgi:hypothetical protein